MDRQAREARKMAKDLSFGKKIAHIWEYDKYWILGGLFVILAVVGTIYSIVNRPKYDMTIAYYSEQPVSQEMIAKMEEYLAGFVEDYDGDGEVTVKVDLSSPTLLDNTPEAKYTVQNKIMAEIVSGSYPIYLVDGIFYDMISEESFSGAMESLRDVTPSSINPLMPENAEQVYWCTRAVYGPEEDKEKRILEHERAVKMELAIFGERE